MASSVNCTRTSNTIGLLFVTAFMTSCVMPATTSLQISANFEDVEFVDGDEVLSFDQDKNPWQRSLRVFGDLGLDVSRRSKPCDPNYRSELFKCVYSRKLYRCDRVKGGQNEYEWKLIGEGPGCEIKCSARVRGNLMRFKARDRVCMYLEPASQAKKCCYECNAREKGIWQLQPPTKICRMRKKTTSREEESRFSSMTSH